MATGVANSLKQFRIIQIGKESTYGTAVAQTRKLRIIGLKWPDAGNLQSYTPDYTIGRMALITDTPTITRTGLVGGSFDTDFSFEDILFPLLAGFKGGVVASAEKTVGQGDKEWIFYNDPNTGDPVPDSYTIGRRLTNGATNWDSTAPGVLIESFEISGDQGGDVTKITINFWSRATAATTITGGLALPTPFTALPALSWKFYIDDTWAAMDTFAAAPSYLGGTQISTTVRSFKYTYHTGITPALFIGDGRTDPSKHRFGPRGAELELVCEFNASINSEIAKVASGSKRYCRLLGEGARIGTGFNKTMLVQGAFIYGPGGMGELGGEADGADTVTLKLSGLPDDDTEDTEIHVINNGVATFPV
jgi:hypothetical protein